MEAGSGPAAGDPAAGHVQRPGVVRHAQGAEHRAHACARTYMTDVSRLSVAEHRHTCLLVRRWVSATQWAKILVHTPAQGSHM